MPELTPEIERELAAVDDALAGRRVAPDLTELGELALALREERPRPDEGFGIFLDKRAERGFPKGDPRAGAPGSERPWWEGLLSVPAFGLAAVALLVAVVVVTGPHGDSEAGGAGSGGGQVAAEAPASSAESAGDARSASGDSAGAVEPDSATGSAEPLPSLGVPPVPDSGSPGTDGRRNRAVERSASLTLAARPRDIDRVSQRIQAVTRQFRGFVLSSTVSASPDGGGGSFQLRIPTRNLDAAMAELSRLARVRERSQGAQDITAQRVSARSRLRDARTERKSLLRQLADAVTLTETESIRRRLDIVAREIEVARAGVRRVNNRAAFATVSVALVADNSVGASGSDDDQWTPGDAAKDALRVLEVAAGVALIVLAVALPLALLAAMAAVAARWTRRRRREQALDAV